MNGFYPFPYSRGTSKLPPLWDAASRVGASEVSRKPKSWRSTVNPTLIFEGEGRLDTINFKQFERKLSSLVQHDGKKWPRIAIQDLRAQSHVHVSGQPGLLGLQGDEGRRLLQLLSGTEPAHPPSVCPQWRQGRDVQLRLLQSPRIHKPQLPVQLGPPDELLWWPQSPQEAPRLQHSLPL